MIQVLSGEIVNQIAAGEVVERPSHLVKELVENSLDAGSDKVLIEVSDGGRVIEVSDNGNGILSSELGLALQRHATSKIAKADDLWNLHSFGFRGEALASAASVSKLTLKSFEKNEKKPAQIESFFGKISDIKPSSQAAGTHIRVEELFDNVPARLKFLKSDSAESSHIKSVVKALALSHYNVEFKLVVNGDLQLYYSKKSSRLERVKDVFEKKELYEAQGQVGSFNCHVVFSSPHEVAKTSKQIWVFAQNRWVQDRALQAAVMDAYRSLLMHGEYPYVVVYLSCPPDEIDVNIHPTKSQVKFQDASNAFRSVHSVLRHALEKAPWINHPVSLDKHNRVTPQIQEVENLKFQDQTFARTQFKNKEFNIGVQDYAALKFNEALSTQNLALNTAEKNGYWSSLQVIGQANLTYIVCQKQDRLVFVDQHAAHERVVYEALMKSWKSGKFEVQEFLFPLSIDLSEDKVEVLMNHASEIEKLGFGIEQMGPAVIGVKSAPNPVKDSSLPLVFEKMADDFLQNGDSFSIEKKISDLFATMACHSVIRAGQSLSVAEMRELLNSMDEYALSSFCPHGRPVSVEKTFNELEKLFGRIN